MIEEEKCSYERTQKTIKLSEEREAAYYCVISLLSEIYITFKQVKQTQFLLTDISDLLKHIGPFKVISMATY